MRVYNLNQATYVDINTRIVQNNMPDLIPDIDSVKWCSLYNLFKCPIGARGPIFQPEYGSNLIYMLQEPLDVSSTDLIELYLIQAIQRWEPRVSVVREQTSITISYNLPGYLIRLAIQDNVTKEVSIIEFDLKRGTQ